MNKSELGYWIVIHVNKITGISHGFHDAAVCTIDEDGNILSAEHAERYSK